MSDEHDGASAEHILRTMLPLVVKAATDSAASSVSTAAALTALENKITDNTNAVARVSVALETFNSIQAQRTKSVTEDKNRLHETLRSVFTPAVIIQLLAIIATSLGIYSQMPTSTVTQPETSLTTPSTP